MITEMVISFEISHQKVQPYYFKGLEGVFKYNHPQA